MGASAAPDMFVEFAYLTASVSSQKPLLTYGPPGAQITSDVSHSHRPSKTALDMVARALKNAGVTPHFDVGCNYQPLPSGATADPACTYGPPLPLPASCASGATWTPSCAIIPVQFASGGEHAEETACDPESDAPCQFPYNAGTVGWKSGYQYFRDVVFHFDPLRFNIFHFVLSAHALGLPKESCLDANGTPDPACQQNNILFHVPRTNSGMGDVGGGDVLHTTGAFGNNFTGRMPSSPGPSRTNWVTTLSAGTLERSAYPIAR